MKKIKLVLLLLVFTFFNLVLSAQEIEVTGKVVAFSSIPVVNATVNIYGSEVSVLTNKEGIFTCMCKDKDKLIITADGFNKLTIKVKKKRTKQVIAKLRLIKSSEASKMAIEKGHILDIVKFEKLVNEQSGIKDYSRYTSVLELIRNEFPSLQIVNGEVIIRGPSSLNGNNGARFEVDGVMTSQSNVEALSTSNIKSIRIIKGSDAAIYGVQGGTGVISIKTKKVSN